MNFIENYWLQILLTAIIFTIFILNLIPPNKKTSDYENKYEKEDYIFEITPSQLAFGSYQIKAWYFIIEDGIAVFYNEDDEAIAAVSEFESIKKL